MKKLNFILIINMVIFLYPVWSQDKEWIGTVKIEEINKVETVVFITDNSKYEISGKLISMLKSFYLNQKIKVIGNITEFSQEEVKQKKLNGKIEIKEIIITLN
ncbi:MAG: hypothetical protein ACK4UJ_12270 [Leptonema sp. (in: bacteria)]